MSNSTHRDGIIIAIDGPAASGKSSTAKAVAAELGYRHLDSGAFYRALTLAILEAGIPPGRWQSLAERELLALQVEGLPSGGGFEMRVAGRPVGDAIRAPDVNRNVSAIAAVPAVRSWLLDALRAAGERGGLVADGRDIGTVVFPDAELKVFLVAAPEERALRRLREQGQPDPSPRELEQETERLRARDLLDSTRAVAPLLRAPDAVEFDTTGLDFDEQVQAILELARARLRG